jgi:hypothetical protein
MLQISHFPKNQSKVWRDHSAPITSLFPWIRFDNLHYTLTSMIGWRNRHMRSALLELDTGFLESYIPEGWEYRVEGFKLNYWAAAAFDRDLATIGITVYTLSYYCTLKSNTCVPQSNHLLRRSRLIFLRLDVEWMHHSNRISRSSIVMTTFCDCRRKMAFGRVTPRYLLVRIFESERTARALLGVFSSWNYGASLCPSIV